MAEQPPFSPGLSVELPVRIERERAAKQVDAANAKFEELKRIYANSADQKIARDRAALERLRSDPHHLDRKLAGNAMARDDEQSLIARIAIAESKAEAERLDRPTTEKIDLPSLIETTTEGMLPQREMLVAVNDLKDLGLNDACINQAVNGSRERPEIIAAAKERLEARLSDPEWVKKLNAGDRATRRELTLINIVLNSTPTPSE